MYFRVKMTHIYFYLLVFTVMQIELVDGYGIFLSKRQLDEALASHGNSPCRLIRNLMSIFFDNDTLAGSSCYGTRKHKELDRDVTAASISRFDSYRYMLNLSYDFRVRAINIQGNSTVHIGRCHKRQMCQCTTKIEILNFQGHNLITSTTY